LDKEVDRELYNLDIVVFPALVPSYKAPHAIEVGVADLCGLNGMVEIGPPS
jgi:hypothetical protein